MKTFIIKKTIFILSIITLYLLSLIIYFSTDNNILFPSPNLIIVNIFTILTDYNLYFIILLEIIKIIVVVFISFIIALLLASISKNSYIFKTYISPYITILRTIPIATLVTILMVAFGLNITPYVISTLVLVPIIYQNILTAFLAVDPEIKNSYQLETNNKLKELLYFDIPLSINQIKASIINALGLGFKVILMVEFICYTPNSLGALIVTYANNLDYLNVYSLTIIIVIIVIIFEKLININKRNPIK